LLQETRHLADLSGEDQPQATLLFEKTRAVSALILERSLYLDCIRPGAPHSSGTGEVHRASRHALTVKGRSASRNSSRARKGQPRGVASKLK